MAIRDLLKEQAGQPFNSIVGNTADSPYSDNYSKLYVSFSKESIEQVLDQAVEELKEEIAEDMPEVVEPEEEVTVIDPPELSKADMQLLVDELKSVLISGFDNMLDINSQNLVPDLLVEQNKTLRELLDKPAPQVNLPEVNPVVRVNAPQLAPIKSIKTRVISRDAKGDISGVEHEVVR